MQSQTIESLVSAAQGGNDAAFEQIYTELFTPVYRYCYIRTHHIQTAEDITQGVFIKAFQSLPKYRQSGKPLLSWLFTIARNALTDWYRKNASAPTDFFDPITLASITDAAQLSAGPSPGSSERGDQILVLAMNELDSELYEIIQLKYVDGWHYRQIATAIGKNESAVRQDVSRALRKLRSKIEDLNY